MATDAILLRESRRRPDAFVEVCERHASDLGAWLRHEVGTGVSEDLLAETLARAWYSRRRYRDPGTGSAGPWLFGIARNLVRQYRRDGAIEARAIRRLGLAPVRDDPEFAAAESRVDAEAQQVELAESIGDLPDDQRRALELRVVDGLSYAEIGSQLAIPTATARTRVHRALTTLRFRLGRSDR